MTTMRHFRTIVPTLAVALAAAASVSCSAILEFPQCVEDIDCTNAEGIDLVCQGGECVAPVPPSTVACDDNTTCIDQFDDTVICGGAGTCASLVTEHCTVMVQPAGDPNAVEYIGSILPASGTYQSIGLPLQNAVQLAVEDFNSVATLPGDRRVGWVACDSQGDSAMARAAATELHTLGIDAVIGPGLSEEVVSVVEITAPRGVFLMSPTASAAVLSQLIDQDLVWRTAGNDAVQAAGIADRIASFDPPLSRVMVLAKSDQYGDGLLASVTSRLESVLPEGGLETQQYSPLDAFADTQALLSEYGARVAATFDHDPEVVVILGSVEARELILFYLEAWAGADPRPALPTFLLSSEAAAQVRTVVSGVSEGFRPTLMSRLEAVGHAAQDTDNYGPFEIRYGIRFPGEQPGLDAGLAYDATMATLLAMSAVPAGQASGAAISEAMARVSDPAATAINFDEALTFVASAQQTLDGGGTVQLRGLSGPLVFTLDNGDLRRELHGYDVEETNAGEARLSLRRRYELDAEPSVTGTWVDL